MRRERVVTEVGALERAAHDLGKVERADDGVVFAAERQERRVRRCLAAWRETLDELRQNLREVIEMLLEDGTPTLETEFIGTQTIQVA